MIVDVRVLRGGSGAGTDERGEQRGAAGGVGRRDVRVNEYTTNSASLGEYAGLGEMQGVELSRMGGAPSSRYVSLELRYCSM